MKKYLPYVALLALAFGLSLISTTVVPQSSLMSGPQGFYLALAVLFAVGYGLNRYAPKTSIPVFVWAILFGMALQIPLTPLMANSGALRTMIELLAAFVLFAGGVEVPVKNFKKYFAPIAALALAGTLLTVMLFSYSLAGLTAFFGIGVPVISLLVLAAILASIDPTALMPTLDKLHFRKPFLRDIAISEGAVNDVVGIVLTRFFLVAGLGAGAHAVVTVNSGLSPLFTQDALGSFAFEVLWGTIVGLLGAWILKTWGEAVRTVHWSDPALFFAVPVFCFALGSIVGNAGYLAAFIAGLLFEAKEETRQIRSFFEGTLGTFVYPVIFVLLGALAPMDTVVETTSIGITAALIFMFVVRPAVVFSSLSPWMFKKRAYLSWREAIFLSSVRETGAISAILILAAVAEGLVGASFVYAIGVWVIIFTLVLEPPLRPLLGKLLNIAD